MTNRVSVGLIVKVFVALFLWYLTSATNNIVNKNLLQQFPYPFTITIVQYFSVLIYNRPLEWYYCREKVHIAWTYYLTMIVPLAIGKFFSTTLSHLSIWKVSVSYSHTVKGTSPLFTVFLARTINKEKQSAMIYVSLFIIITGVVIASVTELEYDTVGLIAALLSTCLLCLQSFFSKTVLVDTGLHHLTLNQTFSKIALLLTTPFWLVIDCNTVIKDEILLNEPSKIAVLLFLDGAFYWAQNLLAFVLISLMKPLTYAVAGSGKRVFVIIFSLIVFGNPVTPLNAFGMTVTMVGIFIFNWSKYEQKGKAVLPFVDKPSEKRHNKEISMINGRNKESESVEIKHDATMKNGLDGVVLRGNKNDEKKIQIFTIS